MRESTSLSGHLPQSKGQRESSGKAEGSIWGLRGYGSFRCSSSPPISPGGRKPQGPESPSAPMWGKWSPALGSYMHVSECLCVRVQVCPYAHLHVHWYIHVCCYVCALPYMLMCDRVYLHVHVDIYLQDCVMCALMHACA